MRASSYIIYVDLPGNSEEMLLLHGYNSGYDKVSRRVASYVRSLESRRPPKPLYGSWSSEPVVSAQVEAPSDETVQTLRRRGYLTDMTVEEEEEFFSKFARKLHGRSLKSMPNYIFMPTYNCNLRCAYCFQDYMRTDLSHQHLLKPMSLEIVDRIFCGIRHIDQAHEVNIDRSWVRSFGFFGGEPLLAANRGVVQYIMKKALEFGPTRFWAVSNATEIDAYEDLLSPAGIYRIQVTLDGPANEHDKRRVYADGSGSFDRIARNITMALGRGVKINVRLNIDRNNIHNLPKLAAEFEIRGWRHNPRFSVYTAPIRPVNSNVDRQTTMTMLELDQVLLEMQRESPALSIFERPDDGIKKRVQKVFGRRDSEVMTSQESFCGAHTSMYLFDAFADIYTCWERTGDPSVRIGRIKEDGTVEMNVVVNNLWRSRTVASNPICRSCRYALYCGGGCAVLAFAKTGKYHSNYCNGFAQRFRASVAEAFQAHFQGSPEKRTELLGKSVISD